MLSARNIQNNSIQFDTFRNILEKDFIKENNRTQITPNDVLLTIVGSIGRSAVVKESTPKFTVQRSVAVITPLINSKFMSYYFQSPAAFDYYRKTERGTAQKGIYLRDLRDMPISVPPINEQVRIVTKIDELFSRLDQGEKNLRITQKQIKSLQQSVLHDAFTGELTKSWRGTHNVSKIPYKDETQNALNNSIPPEWILASINQLAKFIGSGITPKGGKKNYLLKGVPFIRSQNVYPEGLILNDIVFVSSEQHNKMKRTHIMDGDVLLNITGASIGRSTYIPQDFGDGNVNQHVCIIRTENSIVPSYLSWYLNSPQGQEQIMSKQSGQTRQGLNYSQLRTINVPITGLNEQIEISASVDRYMSSIIFYQKQIEVNLNKINSCKQSILKRAFCGGLVAQDLTDEPASVLLENIRAKKDKIKLKLGRGRKMN